MTQFKKVEIVYHNGRRFVKEICGLATDDTPIFTFDGEQVPDEVTEQYKKDGFVMLEDDDGIFLLLATQIKSMRLLER